MATTKFNLSRALVLTLGAGAVAVVRYIGVGMHAEGTPIHGWLWDAANGASGAGMAVLEAVGIWHAWEAWSKSQPSRNRNMLMALIVAMFASLGTMTTAYVYSASQGKQTAMVLEAIGPVALLVWAMAVASAPLLVMASAGMADTLLKSVQQPQTEPDNAQLVRQAVKGAMDALRPEFTQLADATAQQVAQLQTQHEDVAGWVGSIESQLTALRAQRVQRHAPQPVQLPSGGMTWEQGVDALKAQGVDVTPTALGVAVGKHKTSASRWLAQHPEAQS